MAEVDLPVISLILTPKFDSENHATHLDISLTVTVPSLKWGTPIVSFPSHPKNISTIQLSDVRARDEKGSLPLLDQWEEDNYAQEWVGERDIVGEVTFTYSAFPSDDWKPLHCGDTIDFRRDQSGLLGSGYTFLPTLPGNVDCGCIVTWDLSEAPEGTRAVWTFGEGPHPVEKLGSSSILYDSVYMVGRINSTPPADPDFAPSEYGYYWFGNLPSNIEVVRDMHQKFFDKVSDFFNEHPSVTNPYRSFVRRTTCKSFGGTSFTRSHIFDYDSQISAAEDYDLVRRMAYECIHAFVGPPATDYQQNWLYDGIQNLLSVYLPFRPPNQFRTGHYFQATINLLLLRYYTNPLIRMPQKELIALADSGDEMAKQMLAARSWVFMIGLDLEARKKVEQTTPPIRPIEDLAIKPLAVRKREGTPYGIVEGMELLQRLIGDDIADKYKEMSSGAVIAVRVMFASSTHQMQRIDQEMLEFGIDTASFVEGIVKGLKDGTRAKEAGLMNGDIIIGSSHLWKCYDSFEAKMKMTVRRGGEDLKIEYWPRSFEKVEAWKFVKLDGSD